MLTVTHWEKISDEEEIFLVKYTYDVGGKTYAVGAVEYFLRNYL